MLRRRFVGAGLAASAGLLMSACTGEPDPAEPGDRVMPDEGGPHRRTWMAFGASEAIWGADLLPEVRRNLGSIARTIARFEPVSMLVRDAELDLARRLVGSTVELIAVPLDDLWIRDTGPVFVSSDGTTAGVDFNFNGWGRKQAFSRDAEVAAFVARRSGARLIDTDLVLEGGGLEVDGEGTAIITESCVLNDNRNPNWTKADVEAELGDLLGVRKIVWLPGIAGKDITDGHTDFYARFARPGTVVAGYDPDPESFDHEVTKRHLEILRAATDAQGRRLDVVVLTAPASIRPEFASDDFAAGYINFYVCNGAVIAPRFGDRATDGQARQKLATLYPGRTVVQLDIDGIAAGGGGIHCTTQQEPA